MANPTQYGSFVPTTNIWDVGQFMETDVKSREFKELLVRLYQNVNNIALGLNIKDTGMYDTSQFVNGQLYFPNPAIPVPTTTSANYRQVYRTVVNCGALGDTGPLPIPAPHHITCDLNTTFTRIYGVATDPVGLTYIPLPYVDVGGAFNIQLYADANNVNIVTASNRTNYTICYVILEYLLY